MNREVNNEDLSRVEITNLNSDPGSNQSFKIAINGRELKNVSYVDIQIEPHRPPVVRVDILGLPVHFDAKARFKPLINLLDTTTHEHNATYELYQHLKSRFERDDDENNEWETMMDGKGGK